MSTSFPPNYSKSGPIVVSHDDYNYLVHIHPEDRERAKRIAGRKWDGERRVWVYEINMPIYQALIKEFKHDADYFNIDPPFPGNAPVSLPSIPETPDPDYLEDVPFGDDDEEDQESVNIEEGFENITKILEPLADQISQQSRELKELREAHAKSIKTVKALKSSTDKALKSSTKQKKQIERVEVDVEVEVLPESLDLGKSTEMELFENALISLAHNTSKENESFLDWIKRYTPFQNPARFIMDTHEMLKEKLEMLVKQSDSVSTFAQLIYKSRDEGVFFNNPKEMIAMLWSLNAIRNDFSHPRDLHQLDRQAKSIVYLMHLALIWSRVMVEGEA